MVYKEFLELQTVKRFTELTGQVEEVVKRSGIRNGICSVFSCHTTCGVKILENEILSLADIMTFLEKTVPEDDVVYQHDRIDLRDVPVDERVNAASHVRMLFFPSSEVVPVVDGGLVLGCWQTLFLVEMDYGVPFRDRRVLVSVLGDGV